MIISKSSVRPRSVQASSACNSHATMDRRMVASSLLASALLVPLSPAQADTPSEEEIEKRVKEIICASNARAEICWKNSFPPKPKPVEEVLEDYPEISKAALAKYNAAINAAPGTVKVILKSEIDPKMIEALRINDWPIWFSNSIWPVVNKPYPYLYTRTELVYFLQGEVRVAAKGGETVTIVNNNIGCRSNIDTSTKNCRNTKAGKEKLVHLLIHL